MLHNYMVTMGYFKQVNTSDYNMELAEDLNDEMTRAVLPVTIFVGIEVIAAFFGNIFVIYVFLFRYHVCNFRYFVLCLAITDLTSSLTTMPGEMVTQLYWYVYPVPELCKIKSFFNMFTVSAEALCLLTIGVDRYLKICRPLGHQMKPKHAIIICGLIYIIAFILAIPVYILWGTHGKEMVYKNQTILVTVCEKDEKWLETNHHLQYSVAMEVIISICLVIMFVLYVFVVRALLKNKRFRVNAGKHYSPPNSSNPIEMTSAQEVSETDTSPREKAPTSGNLEHDNDTKGVNSKCRESKVSMTPVDDDHDNRMGHSNILNIKEKQKRKKAKVNPPIVVVTPATTSQTDFSCDAITVNSHTEFSDTGISSFLDMNGQPRNDRKIPNVTSDDETDSKELGTTLQIPTQGKHGLPSTARQSPKSPRQSRQKMNISSRVRRKTLIMFILTLIFIATTILYLTLLSFIARSDDILQDMSNGDKAVYFFFFRLYFLNHVINPIVYGLLDPRFKKVMQNFRKSATIK
ncbi:uncharacterized protein LOC132741539 [Ruditapes philippinarum]|uniref:uncharacterized protein LOC132741539 n=1 Tax=Ruditapes philippinarum TaxID=129788 RepID=UPI00295BA71C|nr:uncharacterized protein LOC132741539 [Ruditapes philippinarum]